MPSRPIDLYDLQNPDLRTNLSKSTPNAHFLFQNTAASRMRSLRNVIYAAKIESDLLAVQAETVIISGLHDRARYLQNLAKLRIGKHIEQVLVDTGHHTPFDDPQQIIARV